MKKDRSESLHAGEVARIRSILKVLRHSKNLQELPAWGEPVSILNKKDYLNGRTVSSLIVTLTPSGCEWASLSGGCTMCGEFSGSMGGSFVSGEYYIAQFTTAIAKYLPRNKSHWIRIFNEGSFLNPREVEVDALKIIIALASLLEGVERITIESRTEYVTPDVLKILRDAAMQTVELEIGIGLEAQDDFVRNVCINKGIAKHDFEKTLALTRAFGIRSLAYVLVKPPFLTEGEALEEAVRSVQYAFSVGFDAVKLEPVSIHSWSLVEALSSQGLYRVPWLWTVMDVVKQTHSLGEIRIGGVEYYPPPRSVSHIAHNHHADSDCTLRGWSAIKVYNQTHDSSVFDTICCDCIDLWEKEIQEKPKTSLRDRMRLLLDQFSLESYLKSKGEEEQRT